MTILALLAGFTLKQQHVTKVVHIALILLLLPLTPASVISIPIAAWCLAALKNRSHGASPARQYEDGISPATFTPAPAAALAPDAAKRLRFAFLTTGVLLIVTTVLFFLVSFMAASVAVRVPADETRVAPAWGPLMIAMGILLCTLSLGLWSLFAASSVRRGTRNVMAHRTAIAYLLPITPAWPITFFIGLHCRHLLEELQSDSQGPFGSPGEKQAAGIVNNVTEDATVSDAPGAERGSRSDGRRWLRRCLQAAFVVSLLMFLTIKTESGQLFQAGFSQPWIVVSKNAAGTLSYQFHAWTLSVWIMIAGLVCYLIAYRLSPESSSERRHMLLRPLSLVLLTVLLGANVLWISRVIIASGAAVSTFSVDSSPEILRAVREGNAQQVTSLLEAGHSPDPDISREHCSPLWWAVAERNSEMIEQLLVHGAKPDSQSNDGITPLMLAAKNGDLATCQSLIGLGADVNAQDHVSLSAQKVIVTKYNGPIFWPGGRMTPLMLAADNGYLAVARLLLENGADATLRDASGRTAPEFASHKNYHEVHDLILGASRAAVEVPADQTESLFPSLPAEALDSMFATAVAQDNLDSVKAWKMNGAPCSVPTHRAKLL